MSEPAVSAIRSSEQINEICAALAQAQGAFPTISAPRTANIKAPNGASFSFSYASQGDLWAQVRPALAEARLAVVAGPRVTDLRVEKSGPDGAITTLIIVMVTVTSRLTHASGQWFEVDVLVEAADGGPRAVAGAISHGRKAGFSCLTGAIPDDDDGDRGADAPTQRQASQQRQQAPPRMSEADFRAQLGKRLQRLDEAGRRKEIQEVLAHFAPDGALSSVRPQDLGALGERLRKLEAPAA